MPGYSPLTGWIGMQPPRDFWVPTTTQQHPLGYKIVAHDQTWGYGEFIYGKADQDTELGSAQYFSDEVFTATDIPNTANMGRPVVVAAAAMLDTTYGWYRVAGMGPWSCSVSVAAGVAFGITGAGTVGTVADGKQILNATVIKASTYAPTQTIQTRNGSKDIKVYKTGGLFVGLPVTGTGVASNSTIAALGNNNTVTLNNACTATGTVTGTFTWTGWLLVMANHAFAQGQDKTA